jgi:hypothetical protein
MIRHDIFYGRIETYCKHCEFWTGHACRKGHLPSSSTGCPMKRFEPVNGADYDLDREPDPAEPNMGCCGGNGKEMSDLSWNQVLLHFAMSMVKWGLAGMPVVPEKTHGERYAKCRSCPHIRGFWCSKCKCVAYLKTKLATEGCPDVPPRWLPLG